MNEHHTPFHDLGPRGFGSFSREQLQTALDRFNLGALIGISPVHVLFPRGLSFRDYAARYSHRPDLMMSLQCRD